MKKNNKGIVAMSKQAGKARQRKPSGGKRLTIGLDLGDKFSRCCMLNAQGEVVAECSVATVCSAMQSAFSSLPPSLVALEVGTHSPWVSRLLRSLGHDVVVANARELRAITHSTRKDDKRDARMLARLACAPVELASRRRPTCSPFASARHWSKHEPAW